MLYESLNNETVKFWRKIRSNKFIEQYEKFIVEGEHIVKEAIKTGNCESIILLEGANFDADLPKNFVSKKVMDSISLLDTSPNVMGICSLKKETKPYGDKIIVLDNVQDPGNVGTIIRTAVAFNFDTVILSEETSKLYNSKVIRASQGMIFHTNIITGDLVKIINDIKLNGNKIYTTKMNGAKRLEEVKDEKVCFILGNEGTGVREEIQLLSDETLSIPMNNNCESLNVSITGAIMMYMMR